MFKLMIGFIAGLFAGYLLRFALPIEVFHIGCIVFFLLAVTFFFFFNLGLRDFQGY